MQLHNTDINTFGWTSTLGFVINTHFQSAIVSIAVAFTCGIVGVAGKHISEYIINKLKK